MSYLDIVKKYCTDVLSDVISACFFVKQSINLFLENLERTDIYFNEKEYNKIITFIQELQLSEQEKPTKFKLEPWQLYIIANIYGFYWKENNVRIVNNVYLELPRKNGKSQLITALSMYHLIFGKDEQVIVSANSREQAKNVDFKKVKEYCIQLDPTRKIIKQYYNSVKYNRNEIIVTASDSKRLDGLNASLAIIDELHEAKNGDMYNVLKSSQGSRKQPLILAITTAGFNTESFCYSMREYSEKVLNGDLIDDTNLSIIYTLDDEDDFTDERNIEKANPNLDVSVNRNWIVNEVKKAINNPVELHSVKVKHFNLWLSSKNYEDIYIDTTFIEDCFNKEMKITDEKFKNINCYMGVDLAAINDIAAVSYMFVIDELYYFFNRYYLPEYNQNTLLTNRKYKEWKNEGYLKMIEGNVIDYKNIVDDINGIRDKIGIDINLISFDNWNANQFNIMITNEGYYAQPFSQGTQSINRPLKELARLILSNNVVIEYNPITKWMFSNAIKKTYGDNIRIEKKNPNMKIDGVVAMVTGLGGFLNSPNYSFNVY